MQQRINQQPSSTEVNIQKTINIIFSEVRITNYISMMCILLSQGFSDSDIVTLGITYIYATLSLIDCRNYIALEAYNFTCSKFSLRTIQNISLPELHIPKDCIVTCTLGARQ
jgi:hypothetical protein